MKTFESNLNLFIYKVPPQHVESMGPVPSRPRINTQSQGLTKLLGELETLVQVLKLTLGQGTLASGESTMNFLAFHKSAISFRVHATFISALPMLKCPASDSFLVRIPRCLSFRNEF